MNQNRLLQAISRRFVATAAQSLDKAAFSRNYDCYALSVPKKDAHETLHAFDEFVLKVPNTKRVLRDPLDADRRMVLLDPTVTKESIDSFDIPDVAVRSHQITVGWNQLAWTDILDELLPAEVTRPSAYEQAGHIAHLNLKEEHEPYKAMIGQVVLEKSPIIRTVVNKIGVVGSEFRTFEMELLAGENDFFVKLNESGVNFSFDYSKVYWNSRLQTEHSRIISQVNRNETVLDVFAGVGPFALPMAKHRRAMVYANDLNPDSVRAMEYNRTANNISHQSLVLANMDGRQFIEQLALNDVSPHHIIMNLPASAVDFLDSLRAFRASNHPIKVHCYCFSENGAPMSEPIHRVSEASGIPLDSLSASARLVRKVSPVLSMICVQFEFFPGQER